MNHQLSTMNVQGSQHWIIPTAAEKQKPTTAVTSILRRQQNAAPAMKPLQSVDLDHPPSLPRRSRTKEDQRPIKPRRRPSLERGLAGKEKRSVNKVAPKKLLEILESSLNQNAGQRGLKSLIRRSSSHSISSFASEEVDAFRRRRKL